jgi:coenzyme F420-reducing hydrogenase beta subunit
MLPTLATEKTCTGCLACIDTCNQKAISLRHGEDGFLFVNVSSSLCNGCGLCERVCPVIQPNSKKDPNYSSTPWAVWTDNDKLRSKSTSGGAFAELAIRVIKDNGIVIGAATFGKEVKHIVIDREEDLHLLQGSKYLQSNTEGIYEESFQYLIKGRTVLFSGLPCQIAGIKSFVKTRKHNGILITVDLICHGVPSSNLMNLYEENLGKKIKTIHSFRDKRFGTGFCITKEYLDGKIESHSAKEGDFFLISYGKNLCNRMSCYNCQFTPYKRSSDLSLADFWGDSDFPEQHQKGLSLVISNNLIGENLLKQSNLNVKQTTWGKALPGNPRIICGKSLLQYHPVRKNMVKYFNRGSIVMKTNAFSNQLTLKNSFNFAFWILLRSLSKLNEKMAIRQFLKAN